MSQICWYEILITLFKMVCSFKFNNCLFLEFPFHILGMQLIMLVETTESKLQIKGEML